VMGQNIRFWGGEKKRMQQNLKVVGVRIKIRLPETENKLGVLTNGGQNGEGPEILRRGRGRERTNSRRGGHPTFG